jgi:hypothetical protein
MRPAKLMLLLICLALSFGGSFTCKAESGSDQITVNPKTPAK